MRRWLKWTLLALLALLVLAVLMALWVTTTNSGLRFVLARAAGFVDNALTVGRSEGSLLGGMRLHEVRYHDPDVGDYRVAYVEVAPRSRRLLSGELHLTGLTARGIDIVLGPPSETPPSDEPFELPTVNAPIAMRIDQLLVENIDIRQHDGTQVIALDRVAGSARWAGAELDVDRLQVLAPEGELNLHAAIDTASDWAGDAGLDFRWRLPDQDQPLVGRVDVSGPQRRPSLRLDLREPSAAQVELDWQGQGDAARWQLHAHSQDFDLAELLEQPPIQRLSVDLTGGGDIDSADLRGRIVLDDYALDIERLAGSFRDQILTIDALAIAEADRGGRLDANGQVDLGGDVPTGSVAARWQAITPPLDAPFDRLDSSGEIQATGSLETLVADIAARATVDGQPVELGLHAEGDPQGEIRFAPLRLVTGNGRLEAEGHVVTTPDLSWQADVQAREFDPGLIVPDWPGRIDLDVRSEGHLADGQPHASIDIDRLGGSLKQRPLAGDGQIRIAGIEAIDAELDLRLGENRLRLDGRVGDDNDARARFSLADPALFLDDASGSTEGDLTVRGQWPSLHVAGRIDASALVLAEHQVGRLAVDIDAHTDFITDSRVRVDASELVLAGQVIDSVRLDAGGNEQANRLELAVDAEPGQLELAMAGRIDRDAGTWSGQLATLRLASPELPAPLALREPATLSLGAEQVQLDRACLLADNSGLCLDADWQAATGGAFGFELTRLPLAWLTAIGGDETILIDGELGGRGRFQIDADNRLTGQAHIEGTPGRLRLDLIDSEEELLAWTTLATTLELDGDRNGLDAVIELSPAGQLRARVDTHTVDGAMALDGVITVNLPDLSFIELLTPEVINPRGELSGEIRLAGTSAEPRAQGTIALTGFAAELPAAGLRLRDTRLQLDARQDNRIEVDGRINTADNSAVDIGGWFGLPSNGRVPMDVTVTGERVLVADIPVARVFVSPDLRISADDRRLSVTGDIDVPQAMIHPEEAEGGTARPSADVRVSDRPEPEDEGLGLPIFADVQVTFGDRVNIEGFGLKGQLGGQLRIRERPRRPTTANGEITVTGTYQAYGQDLDIERGRLLFSGPVDNPGLDIRATRRVETVTAGLAVTGNARQPVLEVYSVPAMDQAEALSYLVLGRPLRQATSSEDQDLLGTAATAVTTAGGDLLAKSLGARLGLDEVGVGTSRELGAGALTVGKYLSPRLYLGYGRSLFDGGQLVSLRYRLSERFELEAQSGTRENKAGINYRYER